MHIAINHQEWYNTLIHKVTLMTDEQILELATYYFFEDGGGEWSGTDEGIIEFAKQIQNKLLKKFIIQLEDMIDE